MLQEIAQVLKKINELYPMYSHTFSFSIRDIDGPSILLAFKSVDDQAVTCLSYSQIVPLELLSSPKQELWVIDRFVGVLKQALNADIQSKKEIT